MILTNHAQERLRLRHLAASDLEEVLKDPDKKFNNRDNVKFIKTVDGRRIHVVANFDARKKDWVVVSAWVRGEDDPQPLLWRIIVGSVKYPALFVWWLIKKLWQLRR